MADDDDEGDDSGEDPVARMMRLFRGYEGAHGTHGAISTPVKGVKVEIKKTAKTIRQPVTREVWEKHLSGEQALGVIPINEESECVWGCIDVDKYDLNLGAVVTELDKRKLPLVTCRSKSGGAHVMIFLRNPVAAEALRNALRQLAASLGWGDCEVFPKQSQILAEHGDLGNWLNMPYFGGDDSDRVGVKKTGAYMTLGEFLNYAEGRLTDLSKIRVEEKPDSDVAEFGDGPPCLQHLSEIGFPPGSRNNGMFAMGVYAKKKYPDDWNERLEEYNREFVRPPLDIDEMREIIRSLGRRDYQYQCKEQPIVAYCNSGLCRTRKFGVSGGRDKYPVISGMSKLMSDPPLWFVNIEDENIRLELTTEELQDYKKFHRKCMDMLSITYTLLTPKEWVRLISGAMDNITEIEAPPEAGVGGHFHELLEEFLTNRHVGDSPQDLLMGKPYFEAPMNRYVFRLKDLMAFLTRENFKYWGRNQVAQRILDLGGGKGFVSTRKGSASTFWITLEQTRTDAVEDDLPHLKEDPI